MQYNLLVSRSFQKTVNDLKKQGLNQIVAEQIAQQALIAKRAPSIEKARHAQAMRRLSTYIHLFD